MLQPNFRKVAFIFDHSISIEFKSGLYGGRYVPRGCNWGAPYFNSRPSARGDPAGRAYAAQRPISIHAPPRGATSRERQPRLFGVYFNSRPSARGDDGVRLVLAVRPISIHAPPRGATTWVLPSQAALAFQFTPLREGRRCASKAVKLVIYFNSRPSARGDAAAPSTCPQA